MVEAINCLEVIKNGGKVARTAAPKPQVYPSKPSDFDTPPSVVTYKVSGTQRYGGYLNLRKGPSNQYGKIGGIPEGLKGILILKKSNGWAKVQLSSGHKGWVSAKFLKAV